MPGKIVIVDYQMGNIHSVARKLARLQATFSVTADPREIGKADKLILPGVGHFMKAMQYLDELHLIDVLNDFALVKCKPILGICLGMQLMANASEEGNVAGLGWIDAQVVKFRVKDKLAYKVPHTGWNQIVNKKESILAKGIPDSSEFYFVHSYHLVANDSADVLHETTYEYSFPSAVEKGNIFGVQYHPEKSHGAGELLLKNFISL